MTPLEVLLLLWAGIVLFIVSLLFIAARGDEDEWDRLARDRYIPPGYQRVDVNIIDRPFDFEQWEHEVEA